jgi:hypothetical protein
VVFEGENNRIIFGKALEGDRQVDRKHDIKVDMRKKCYQERL